MKKSRLASNIVIAAIFILGISVLMYPTISDLWNRHVNATLISDYDSIVENMSEEDYNRMYQEAVEYNKQHRVNVFYDAFADEDYILTHPYDYMLNPDGNNIMGYLEIPKIGQRLAIGHGTGVSTLEKGVGHLEGTSLPIGGESSHCVLAGHRGLPNAKILTDADELIVGDKFYLFVLKEVLAYEIDQIVVVLPEEAEELAIKEGEDLCTLLTCTPYGINSHRMFIRGHRIPYDPNDLLEEKSHRIIAGRDKPIYALAGGVVLLFIIIMIMKRVRKKKAKDGAGDDRDSGEGEGIGSKEIQSTETTEIAEATKKADSEVDVRE